MVNRKQKTKIRISIIISIVSICIAVLSLSYTIHKDIRDYNTQKEIKELQVKGANFDESYKKISLAEQNLMDEIQSCENNDKLNRDKVNMNMQLLISARQAVISNNNQLALSLLSQMKEICSFEEIPIVPLQLQKTIELFMLILIWTFLIIAWIVIERKN